MISIIVSSYQKHYLESFCKNVEETINVPYEIIDIWNPGSMGICEAYNLGAKKAQHPYLVFCHEDILFRTKNWGNNLILHLDNPEIGVVGVAGSSYVTATPTGWYLYIDKYNLAHYIQNTADGTKPSVQNIFPSETSQIKAFALDGVFLGLRKSVYDVNPFNESLKGFHGYDITFSLQIAKKYKNCVVNDILLEHFSKGNFDDTWFEHMLTARKLVGNYQYNRTIDKELEYTTFIRFFSHYAKHFGVSKKTLQELWKICPFHLLKFKDKIQVMKLFYYHYKYQNAYNLKYKEKKNSIKS